MCARGLSVPIDCAWKTLTLNTSQPTQVGRSRACLYAILMEAAPVSRNGITLAIQHAVCPVLHRAEPYRYHAAFAEFKWPNLLLRSPVSTAWGLRHHSRYVIAS